MKSLSKGRVIGRPKTRGSLVVKEDARSKQGGNGQSLLIEALDDFLRSVQQYGLSMSQLHLLVILTPLQEGSVRLSELASMLGLTSGGVTGVADQLVNHGLVTRNIYPEDRRSVYLALTPGGIEVVSRIESHLVASLAGAISA